jgi:predicted LPLAT superfamily acyltransferase
VVAADEAVSWRRAGERGSSLGISLLDGTTRLVGRRGGRLLLRFVMAWFLVFGGRARRALRQWLALTQDRVRWRDVYRHFFTFGTVALDRFALVRGDLDGIELESASREVVASRAGGILLGAHLGSFEAMGAFGRDHDLPVYPAMYTEQARRIQARLRTAAPEVAARVVELREGDPGVILKLRRLIAEGGWVALLGDRAAGGRTVTVEFFGRPAEVAAGPYLLAAALRCPVIFVACVYEEPNRYRLRLEPLFERVELPRGDRDEGVRRHAQEFADRLETLARAHPYNWFNFYDFWGEERGAGLTDRGRSG